MQLSSELEAAIQSRVGGEYSSQDDVVRAAMKLLEEREQLLRHIDEGTRQLRSGEAIELDEAGLHAYFDSLQARGRERYNAR